MWRSFQNIYAFHFFVCSSEAKAVYLFNNEHFTITFPLPLGGKSTEELNFPSALTTPYVSLPKVGLEIASRKIPIPVLFVPERLTLAIPLGKLEVSAGLKTNIYDLEAKVAFGKDAAETPTYLAKFDVEGISPLDFLTVKIGGNSLQIILLLSHLLFTLDCGTV